MPMYEFKCSGCGGNFEIFRLMKEDKNPGPCKTCGETLERVFTAPNVNVSQTGYHCPALGRYIGSKQDKIDAIKSYKDKTGDDLIEVGNEYNALKKKTKKQSYKLTRDDINRALSDSD